MNVFEIMLKNNMERKFAEKKKAFKHYVEQKRRELTKSLFHK